MSICISSFIDAPVRYYELRCCCGAHSAPFDERPKAVEEMVSQRFGCGVAMPECANSNTPDWCKNQMPTVHAVAGEESPFLSLANNNARSVLTLLKLSPDDSGTIGTAELLTRVENARNAGLPHDRAIGDYFERVFERLSDIAEWAEARNVDVSWA